MSIATLAAVPILIPDAPSIDTVPSASISILATLVALLLAALIVIVFVLAASAVIV